MDDAAFFDTFIRPSIPDLDSLSAHQAAIRMKDWVYQSAVLATDGETLINDSLISGAATLWDTYEPIFAHRGGLWCAGTAAMLARVLMASGRVQDAWVYAYGIEPDAVHPRSPAYTHAVVLAVVDGALECFDSYLNTHYDQDYRSVLAAIKAHNPLDAVQAHAPKTLLASRAKHFQGWRNPLTDAGARVWPAGPWVRMRSVVTEAHFAQVYFEAPRVIAELTRRGYPSPFWPYLHLHPLWITNPYPWDADPSKDRIWSRLQHIVGSVSARPSPRDPSEQEVERLSAITTTAT